MTFCFVGLGELDFVSIKFSSFTFLKRINSTTFIPAPILHFLIFSPINH